MTEAGISRKIGIRTILFPVFVVIAIIAGLVLGFKVKAGTSDVATYGIPIGLFFMIYPAMTKVRLNELGKSLRNFKTVGLMVLLNYAIAPFLVAGIAYFFIYEVYWPLNLIGPNVASQMLVGIILLGVAPCIAMVMVWTDLAHGNLPLGVSFVAWNSIIQVITTPFLVYLLARTSVIVKPELILESVILYLALPLIAGVITRRLLQKKNYFSRVLNRLGSVQTVALLFTILVIFWGEGFGIIDTPSLVWMVGIVMLIFYFLLFQTGYLTSRRLRHNYPDSTAIGFTVSARDFEVSIAIAIAAFAVYPYVVITTAIGPLLEIPLMLFLVWVQLGREQKINTQKRLSSMEIGK
ncbi:MAG: bile acid:sodium symporter [Candidatus Thermoplasmatota archaeon]|jgi:ACR3 family arsenite transporter|nr:bile acid:sodium symporter [Candidatus Thermoplasmatota archaeon]MCL5789118.1 bile acid:sodium symporter [Candidatus Thermoplasmatota archaeon]